ncbi:MAG: two-component regulator propeller domain-containing protein [Bacteroidota bacterium]
MGKQTFGRNKWQGFYSSFCWILTIGWLPLGLWGQSNDPFQLERISIEQGLSQSSVNALAQDEQGFLWIGTQDGLNKFDGLEFEYMRSRPFDTSSLSNNFISSLLVDHKNRLWVGSMRDGLNLYQRKTKTFQRFYHHPDQQNSLSGSAISSLYQDNNRNIWIVSYNGLNQVIEEDYKSGRFHFRHYLKQKISYKEKGGLQITCLYQDAHQQLWVGTNRGLLRYRYKHKHKIDAPEWAEQLDFHPSLAGPIHSIVEDANGCLHVSAAGKLWQYDSEADHFAESSTFQSKQHPIDSKAPLFLHKNKKGDLILIGKSKMWRLHFRNHAYASCFKLIRRLDTLHHIHHPFGTQPFLEDQLHDELYWMGTHIGGLLKIYEKRKQFHSDHLKTVSKHYGQAPIVWSIAEDPFKNIWLRLENGFVHYNQQSQRYRFLSHIPTEKAKHLSVDDAKLFYIDDKGQAWLAGRRGLFKAKINEKGAIKAQRISTQDNCRDKGLFCLQPIAGNRLLFGTYTGVRIFDLKKETFLSCPIPTDRAHGKPTGRRVTNVLLDSKNNLWLGTQFGLVLYRNLQADLSDLAARVPELYFHDKKDPSSLVDNTITTIVEDAIGRIWISTMTGLSLVEQTTPRLRFRSFTEADGLANNIIYGVLKEDNSRFFWISTNNGLSRFDTETFSFYNYHASDGLQSNEFNGEALYKSKSGELFFGGISGYTRFRPTEIRRENQVPPIWISEVVVNRGERFNLLSDTLVKPLRLSYDQRSFSVHFVGLDYLNPKDLTYYYDLEGGDLRNVAIGKNRELYFSNLTPGRYLLHIKAINKDGIINRTGNSLEFVIDLPFWKSPWFYTGILAFLVGMVGLLFYVWYRMKLNKIAEIEAVRQLAAQDFHDELGSKLSIISLYSELGKKGYQKGDQQTPLYLEKVTQTSNSLYDSMKDLLWSLNPNKDSLRDLFIHLKDFGEELFTHSDIEFQSTGMNGLSIASTVLPMNYKRHLLLIGKEAMNNCLRHAKCRQVRLQMHYNNKKLVLQIEDDGQGFDLEREKLGDGLHNMQSRARKVNGSLTIKSSEAGTLVQLNCPIGTSLKPI